MSRDLQVIDKLHLTIAEIWLYQLKSTLRKRPDSLSLNLSRASGLIPFQRSPIGGAHGANTIKMRHFLLMTEHFKMK